MRKENMGKSKNDVPSDEGTKRDDTDEEGEKMRKENMGKSKNDVPSDEGTERDATPNVSADLETIKRLRSEDLYRELVPLLPGIPNDIVLHFITQKLSWRDFYILSSVSRVWRRAIQDHLVYDSRVKSQSTETFVVVPHVVDYPSDISDQTHILALGLCCMRDRSWCDLPPIPFTGGLRTGCRSISLHGRIYLLGGNSCDDPTVVAGERKQVYVLDLAGARKWKQCKSMHQSRYDFSVSVLDGKIYVFGGLEGGYDCEIYDPKADSWSLISSFKCLEYYLQVATVGDDLFVYGERRANSVRIRCLDIYRRLRLVPDCWSSVQQSKITEWDSMFVAEGKFHRLTDSSIDVYNIEKDSWERLHSFEAFGDGKLTLLVRDRSRPSQRFTVALGDELLSVHPGRNDVVQTKGFGGKNGEIEWERVKGSLRFNAHTTYLCPVEL